MRGYLLDTHALIWWNAGEGRLGRAARNVIEDGSATIYASPINAFEIATKHRLGKLPLVASLLENYHEALAQTGFRELPVNTAHALRAGLLVMDNRDPFDRLLIAQALVEDLVLLSSEQRFDATGVARIWN